MIDEPPRYWIRVLIQTRFLVETVIGQLTQGIKLFLNLVT